MRPISGKRMLKVLRKRGWVHVRTEGSHFIHEHPDSPETISVPVHANRDMKPGTQHKVMRQAGLADADL